MPNRNNGEYEGAWRCGRDESKFCPIEGCSKGYCALTMGWREGEPTPIECITGMPAPDTLAY